VNGITAQGFAADVRDTAALEQAIDTAAATLGPHAEPGGKS
jgi:hypothetical protein